MIVAVIVVEFTTVTPVTITPLPETVTDVPVVVKLVPVNVTGTLELRKPLFGDTALRVGGGGAFTVNVIVLVPPGVVTVTLCAPNAAVVAMLNVAVTVVSLTTVRPLTVTPAPEMLIAVVVASQVPVIVTGTLLPSTPEAGAIDVSVGGGGAFTVNVTALLVPPAVVTVTFLGPSAVPAEAVPGEIMKVAVIVVSFTTMMLLAVTPVPETLIPVVLASQVPVSVTGTL